MSQLLAELAHASLPMAPAVGALRRASAGGDGGRSSASVLGQGLLAGPWLWMVVCVACGSIWTLFSRVPRIWFFFSACVDGGYSSMLPFFYVKLNSGLEVDSRPPLRRVIFKIAEWISVHR